MVFGVMQGYGTLFWKDGSHYSGQFVNNSKSGEGTLFYANGDIFTGQWADEAKAGQGKYMFSKGGDYNGGFSSGAFNGDGEFNILHPNDDWEYFKGRYEGGQRKTGQYKLTSGDSYEGSFLKDGKTNIELEPGTEIGELREGSYDGQGKYVWACGKVYEGSFVNGLPYGKGVMTYPEGYVYEGRFYNGEMTSGGTYYTEEGGVFKRGQYYPNAADESVSYQAEFDGKTLRYKKPVVTKGGVKKGGY